MKVLFILILGKYAICFQQLVSNVPTNNNVRLIISQLKISFYKIELMRTQNNNI